jgi:DnaK suppressor protein
MGAHYLIERRRMRTMEPKLVEEARLTLETERARLQLTLAEEVEHPRVAHGAQTAAATEVTESQRGDQMRERESKHLVAIEGALRRIEAGTFGRCETCGLPIAPERLEALPWATDCVSCHTKTRR